MQIKRSFQSSVSPDKKKKLKRTFAYFESLRLTEFLGFIIFGESEKPKRPRNCLTANDGLFLYISWFNFRPFDGLVPS